MAKKSIIINVQKDLMDQYSFDDPGDIELNTN